MAFKNVGILMLALAAGLPVLLSALPGFAQGQKINGYIVRNDGERIACHVFNTGNEEATSFYEYILPDSVKSQKMELSRIQEFGIGNELKFVRELIQIDVSGSRIKREEDATKGPDLDEGHAYLKVLYEGPRASLYSFFDQGRTFYYYKVGASSIELLYYKQYQLEVASGVVEKIIEDNRYKEQLASAFNLKDQVMTSKLSYTKRSLLRFFETINQAEGGSAPALYKEVSQGIFRVRALGGVNFLDYRLQNLEFSEMVVFSSEQSLAYGLGFEYIFPYNKSRWGIFLEVLYASYQSDQASELSGNLTGYEIDYKSLEFPAGVSFNFPVARKSHLFVKAGYVPHIILKSSSLRLNSPQEYEFSSAGAGVFGAGFRLGRFSAEYRYNTNRNITQNHYNRESRLSQSSIIVGISLFQVGKE